MDGKTFQASGTEILKKKKGFTSAFNYVPLKLHSWCLAVWRQCNISYKQKSFGDLSLFLVLFQCPQIELSDAKESTTF